MIRRTRYSLIGGIALVIAAGLISWHFWSGRGEVLKPEGGPEFSDQVTHFERCLDCPFNRDIHGASANVNLLGSLGGRSDSRPL